MRLDKLLPDLDVRAVHGDPTATDITAVTHDSRAVSPGALFCCVSGLVRDGHDYAPEAVARGATALLCERRLPLEVTQVELDDVRRQMGRAAAAFHGHPSRSLRMCGVTGTNGKTTVAHLLGAILEAHGWRTEVVGTLSGQRTTPESTDLQASLRQMRDDGVKAVAMEVSSHALALHRVAGVSFAVAIFTNLSRDHLEFHGSMEAYFQAKARLFEPDLAALGVVNIDDPHGQLLHQAALIPTRGYSLADADDLDAGVTECTYSWQGERVRLPMGGIFNVSNAIAAATAAHALDVPVSTIVGALSSAPRVPGRFEPVDAGQSFTLLVDYAHTPDALERVLEDARRAGRGQVLVVFGCGGDRDPTKRPMMGEVASRLADTVFLTSDNPRHEDPMKIIDAVLAGIGDRRGLVVEPHRRTAIRAALAAAQPGDVVVVAGKGHESVQVLGDRTIPFDDRTVAREELALIGSNGGW